MEKKYRNILRYFFSISNFYFVKIEVLLALLYTNVTLLIWLQKRPKMYVFI